MIFLTVYILDTYLNKKWKIISIDLAGDFLYKFIKLKNLIMRKQLLLKIADDQNIFGLLKEGKLVIPTL